MWHQAKERQQMELECVPHENCIFSIQAVFASVLVILLTLWSYRPYMGIPKEASGTEECLIMYTGSLAPADFSGAVFTHAHFQKIAQISSLRDFHYISEGIPSLMHFGFLMT